MITNEKITKSKADTSRYDIDEDDLYTSPSNPMPVDSVREEEDEDNDEDNEDHEGDIEKGSKYS